MLENVNPVVAFGVMLAVVIGIKWFAGRKQGATKPKPISDVFGKLLEFMGREGLGPLLGDITRLLINGDLPAAATKAESTLETLSTPNGVSAATDPMFDTQLDRRLQTPEGFAKISAKVEQYRVK